jgi:hypothetical protein
MTEGYIDAIKMKLVEHISSADSTLAPSTIHVLPNLDEDMWKYDTNNMPIVTVRIGPSNIRDEFFGRQLGGAKRGTFKTFFFTAHLFMIINETSNEDKSKNAMQLADKIETKLLTSKDNDTGIMYYYEITTRQSPSGMAKIAKVIIEGYIYARKPFI